MKRLVTIEIISAAFLLLFVYAALNKLVDYQKFTIQIGQSPVLVGLGTQVAVMVVGSELLTSFLLCFTATRLLGLYSAFLIMVAFTVYIIVILGFSENIPCSCGGILEKMGWQAHLAFNIAFVMLGAVGVILESKQRSVSEGRENNMSA